MTIPIITIPMEHHPRDRPLIRHHSHSPLSIIHMEHLLVGALVHPPPPPHPMHGGAFGQVPAPAHIEKPPEQLEKERMAATLFGGMVPGAPPPPPKAAAAPAPPAAAAPPPATAAPPVAVAPPPIEKSTCWTWASLTIRHWHRRAQPSAVIVLWSIFLVRPPPCWHRRHYCRVRGLLHSSTSTGGSAPHESRNGQ
jgi:hypothetical protein